MALSGSTDFVLNRDEMITSSLRIIGAYAPGETAAASELSDGSEVLNLMLKSWIADGMQLWVIKNVVHTMVADTESYTLGTGGDITIDRPEKVLKVIYRNSTPYDREIELVSRNEYWSLSDKDSKGAPTLSYYDPQLTNGVLYVWPVLDTIDAATPEKLVILYQKPFDDLDAATNDFEFPQYYLNAIRWNLAYELGFEYGVPDQRLSFIGSKAMKEKQKVMDYDTEEVAIYIQPESENYRGV